MRSQKLKSISIGHDQGVSEYSGEFTPFKEVGLTFSRLGPAYLELTVDLFTDIIVKGVANAVSLADIDKPFTFTAMGLTDDGKTYRLFIPAVDPVGSFDEIHVHRERKAEITAKFDLKCRTEEIRLETLSPASSAQS